MSFPVNTQSWQVSTLSLLLKFENKLDTDLKKIYSKQHNKCKFACKFIHNLLLFNIFSFRRCV